MTLPSKSCPQQSQKPNSSSPSPSATLEQALRELQQGEQTAAALESNLTKMEDKLDALLAALVQEKEGGDKRE